MATKNNITGDEIKSKPLSKKGRENWDNIFKKQSAWNWLKELNYDEYTILDPDGWRYNDGVDLNTPITKSDFFKRFNESTVMFKSINEKIKNEKE